MVDTRVDLPATLVESRTTDALCRAEALISLAILPGPVEQLLSRAVEIITSSVSGSTAAVYLVESGQGVLAAVAGGVAPQDRAIPSGVAARDSTGLLLTLRGEAGQAVALLDVRSEALVVADYAFITRVGDVISASLVAAQQVLALRTREARLVEAQRISQVGSYDFDIASNTNLRSDQLYRLYGCEPQSFNATYEKFMSLLHPEDRATVAAVHAESLATLESFEMEERIVWPDGTIRTLASWGEIVCDAQGRPARMVGICWDITERRAIEEQLVREALHDRLTGLPNRALLLDRLGRALGALQRHGNTLAVLFIDIDHFKVINDSLGHEAGDQVLIEVAHRLEAAMRPGDTVGRLGGDEFVVLCEELDRPAHAVVVAARLQQALYEPMTMHDAELVITVSIGIALPATGSEDAGALLRDADSAMYRAKHNGRSRSVLFADAMRTEAMDRIAIETQLRRALVEDQLRVHYQPIVDVISGALVGMEALVRWEHPTRGLLSPDDFITIAEESGLVVPLGAWVLERACEQLVHWHRSYPHLDHLTMSVNLSAVQVGRADLSEKPGAILERTGVVRSAINLEITESVLMRSAADTMEVLRELKALGIRLSVDDFGTGYSSLGYLRRLPVDILKIDRSFVAGLGTDAEDSAIVEAIQALAVSMGMTTVAEGVEEEVQLTELRRLGCRSAQGHFFSKAGPAEDFGELLAKGTPAVLG